MGVDGDSTCSYQSVGQTFGEQTRLNGKKSGMNVMLSKLSSLINKKKALLKLLLTGLHLLKLLLTGLHLSYPFLQINGQQSVEKIEKRTAGKGTVKVSPTTDAGFSSLVTESGHLIGQQ